MSRSKCSAAKRRCDVSTRRSLARASDVRRAGFVAATAVVSLAVYFVVSLVQVWTTGRDDWFVRGNTRVDAIVVLGAAQYDGRPSPQFASRLDHALLLWNRGSADEVIVTGGKQSGDRFTEAESGRDYLVARGVPASAVQVEPRGASTYESLEAVAALLGPMQVVIVSDPYHVLRARLVAGDDTLRISVFQS
ncbi:MAG: YdcF family protein [Rhodobacteraceae bacterium]|nr:YdcF family protein [Paracoccaceae bacterium]